MAALTGKKPKNTYKDLLQVSNSNAGIDGTLRFVSDGEGTDSTLKLSTSSISTTSKVVVGGDTAAGDDAAIGYTSAEGLIITGQGSTSDITVKNDADAAVLTVATGTTNVDIVGDVTASTVNADGDTSAGDDAAMGYTSAEGLILTGQGSTNDITIKNDADAAVISVPTGTTNVTIAGDLTVSGDDLTMGTNTSGAALIADGTNFNPVVISGDATVATNGALTIANDAITSAKIADDAITSALIADDAVGSAAIADDAITAALIADDAVGSAAIADDAITSALIADDAVVSAAIADDAVVTASIADDAITSALIADDAVVSAAIADSAVTTALINDDAVTLAKMAGLARGKLIYGDSSGNPAALAIGSANYVLTSDGTDFAWASASSGAVTSYTNSTDNRVITSVNSTTINGEANLTFDGSVLAVTGNVTASGTVEPAGDTSAGDNAAIGYTSAEGLILTGQGSTNDITIKNDADADVFTVPTGTTAPAISGQQMPSAGGLWSGRNMVINGAMNISQRSTSVASITSTGYYALDRWQVAIVNGGTWTMSQDTDVPAAQGFLNSLKMDCTTADASFGAADYLYVRTKLEAQDCMRIRKGTANAEQVTVSFWTKSAKTGVHIVELLDNDNSRFVSASYTISSADTWENHSVTFPADTTGAFADDNGAGLGIHFYMGAGSNYTSGSLGTTWGTTQANRAVGQVNVADNTANNWYLTGVQLEVGTAITPFEHESYGETLQKCMRYYQLPQTWTAHSDGSTATAWKIQYTFAVPMRASPTIGTTGTPTVVKMNANAAGPNTISVVPTANTAGFTGNSFTTMATGSGSSAATDTPYVGEAGFTASAEL